MHKANYTKAVDMIIIWTIRNLKMDKMYNISRDVSESNLII